MNKNIVIQCKNVSKVPLTKKNINFLIQDLLHLLKVKTFKANIIFCSDKELKDLNNEFRNKDEVTDILTFPYSNDFPHLPITKEIIKMNGDIFIATAAVRDDGTSKQYIPIEFPAIASHNVVSSLIKASKDLNIDSKVGICQSKDSFFGETEPDRMPVAPYLDFKWKSWQEGGVGASEMEAATLFTLSQIKRIEAGAILAIETSDKETIKKMTEIVLESITYMEREKNVS